MKQPWGLRLLSTPAIGRLGDEQEPLERKAAALLAYLALQGPSHRSTLAGLLWPNVVETRARNNLRQLLYRLRAYDGLIESDGALRLGDVVADASELVELAADGRFTPVADRWGAQRPTLLEGHDYDDCPDLAEWVLAERERLLGMLREALAAAAEHCEAAGATEPALAYAQQLSALDPLSEAGYRRLMRLHYLAGDRGQALAVFERCRRILRDTFGLEPLPDTLELARAIDSGATPSSEPRPARDLPITLHRPPSLVGREDAWEQLEEAWSRAHTILVVGEAGIGKSRLIRDFARTKGDFVVTRGMPGDRHVPYASKARALSELLRGHPERAAEPWVRHELARILPDLFEAPPGQAPITDEPQKLRLFEAAAIVLDRALSGSANLVNEDLHLWDDASFEMGAYFASRFADAHAHALTSFRRDELSPAREHGLLELVESGLAVMIELRPLGTDALGQLIAEASLGPDAPEADTIERLSGGNPFYALEVLRNLWQERVATPPPDALPSSAATVLAHRIERLSGTAADLLRVRAMAAESFSLELASAVLQVPVSTVGDAVDELERHRLLDRGELAHELLANAIEAHTPAEALRLWHLRLATELAARRAPAPAVATHYLAARDASAAYPHLLAAGDRARDVFALDESRRWYFGALWASPDDHGRADALLRLDDLAVQQGRREDARAILEEVAPLARHMQDAAMLLEVGLRQARWAMLQGDHGLATNLASETLHDAKQLGDDERVHRAHQVLGDIAYLSGAYDTAQMHFLEASKSAKDAHRLRAFQRLGALEALRGEVELAFEHHRQALLLARRAGDLPLVATLLNSLGADRERRGAYGDAQRYFEEAEGVAMRAADRRTAGIALSNAALVAVSRGAFGDALRNAGRAIEVAASLGADRALAMATFTHGYVLRRLGFADDARTALEKAASLRRASGDVRGALVADFNLAALELEQHDADLSSARRVDALLDEIEELNVPQFCAWCHLEVAVITPASGAARAHIERALELDDSDHLRFAAAVTGLSEAIAVDDRSSVSSERQRVMDGLGASPVMETSRACLLLADSSVDEEEREGWLTRAKTRLAEETAGLPTEAASHRRRYLERRLPKPIEVARSTARKKRHKSS